MSSALLRTNIALIMILYVSWLGKHSSPLLILWIKSRAFLISQVLLLLARRQPALRPLLSHAAAAAPPHLSASSVPPARSLFPEGGQGRRVRHPPPPLHRHQVPLRLHCRSRFSLSTRSSQTCSLLGSWRSAVVAFETCR